MRRRRHRDARSHGPLARRDGREPALRQRGDRARARVRGGARRGPPPGERPRLDGAHGGQPCARSEQPAHGHPELRQRGAASRRWRGRPRGAVAHRPGGPACRGAHTPDPQEGRSRASNAEWMDLDVDEVVDGARPLLAQLLGEGSALEVNLRGPRGVRAGAPRADRAGAVQPHRQRARRPARRGCRDDRDGQGGSGRRGRRRGRVRAPRPMRPSCGARHGSRHGRGDAGAGLRAPLHHQAQEKGSGLGLATVAPDREGDRRPGRDRARPSAGAASGSTFPGST